MAIDILQAFEETPPPLDFVLPGLLAGTVGGIVSPGGAGKSMLALELAILVATGRDLSGFSGGVQRHTGKVVFLAAEDPADALRHRPSLDLAGRSGPGCFRHAHRQRWQLRQMRLLTESSQ